MYVGQPTTVARKSWDDGEEDGPHHQTERSG